MATVRLVKERLAYGFNGDKMIFSTDDQYIYLVGDPSDDKVRDKLVEVNKSKICPYETRMIEPLGLIPHRKKKSSSEIEPMPFAIQFLIPIEKFSDLPPSEEVKIVSDSKSLKLTFDDNLGSRDRPIPIRKTVGTPQVCSVDFNMKILQQLTAQFEGEIWMSLNDGMVCLSQANKDNSLTYLFAAKEVS